MISQGWNPSFSCARAKDSVQQTPPPLHFACSIHVSSQIIPFGALLHSLFYQDSFSDRHPPSLSFAGVGTPASKSLEVGVGWGWDVDGKKERRGGEGERFGTVREKRTFCGDGGREKRLPPIELIPFFSYSSHPDIPSPAHPPPLPFPLLSDFLRPALSTYTYSTSFHFRRADCWNARGEVGFCGRLAIGRVRSPNHRMRKRGVRVIAPPTPRWI